MISDKIELRPQKGSLTDIIIRERSNFHKSPEAVEARTRASEAYKKRRKAVIDFLYEENLPLRLTTDMVYHWDGTEEAKNYFRSLWEQHLEDERYATFEKEIAFWKSVAESTGMPLSFYMPELEEVEEEEETESSETVAEDCDSQKINEDDYLAPTTNEKALIDGDGFEIIVRKKKGKKSRNKDY